MIKSIRHIEQSWLAIVSALGGIAIVDIFLLGSVSLLVHGVGDVIAHIATAFLAILALRLVFRSLPLVPALIAGVAVDLDKVPELLGLVDPPVITSRQETHSLVLALVVLIVAVVDVRRMRRWLAASLGVLSHLVRDLGTGTVMLWWPISSDLVFMSYRNYAALMLVFAILAAVQVGRTRRARHKHHLVSPSLYVPNGRVSVVVRQRGDREGLSN